MKRAAVILFGLFLVTGVASQAEAQHGSISIQRPISIEEWQKARKAFDQRFGPLPEVTRPVEATPQNRGVTKTGLLIVMIVGSVFFALVVVIRIALGRFIFRLLNPTFAEVKTRRRWTDLEDDDGTRKDYTSVDALIQERLRQIQSGQR